MERYMSEGLMALVSVYLDMKGDCTLLYTLEGGKTYVEKSLISVLNSLAKYFLIDLKESRKYYGTLLSTKNLVPISLNKDYIFILWKPENFFIKMMVPLDI